MFVMPKEILQRESHKEGKNGVLRVLSFHKARSLSIWAWTVLVAGVAGAEVVIWPAAEGTAATNGEYQVTVNGRPVDVIYIPKPHVLYECHFPEEARQSYFAAFFDADEEVAVTVDSPRDLTQTCILPTAKGIRPIVESAHRVTFRAKPPFNVSFEPTPRHRALVFAANLPERNVPKPTDPNVRFFAPGRHHFDKVIEIGSNQTVYFAPGAWVEGGIWVKGTNVTICGRGVLSGLPWERYKGPHGRMMEFRPPGKEWPRDLCWERREPLRDITVRDVTLIGSWSWTLVTFLCENVLIDNVKILNGHVLNDDGIDVCKSRNVTIRNCFVRAQDDCIAPKYWVEGLKVENCALWTDVANIIRVGYECDGAGGRHRFSDLTFKNVDSIHQSIRKPAHDEYWSENTIQIQAANDTVMEEFLFEDFRIDHPEKGDHFLKAFTFNLNTDWNPGKEPGHIRNIRCRNVSVIGDLPEDKDTMGIWLQGTDAAHTVDSVSFENVDSRFPVTRRNLTDQR